MDEGGLVVSNLPLTVALLAPQASQMHRMCAPTESKCSLGCFWAAGNLWEQMHTLGLLRLSLAKGNTLARTF